MILLAAGVVFAQIPTQSSSPENYSGMYSFRQEGEFVQITIEDAGHVTGFISRYGDGESDRGVFLNQFFKQGSFDGKKLNFTTQTVHGVWYEFRGTIERAPDKAAGAEGYHVVKGTLTENRADKDNKNTTKSTEVMFRSFPQEAQTPSHPD